ncbi:DUF192 domain-containing protein [Gaetbulibacter aestuarii]|uniref:DUF192 domain-containing protein n=1 Tax=Gaetbulibacter aestuarii TaxID=1502358 RepID=A0ABW7MX83_9FLAO
MNAKTVSLASLIALGTFSLSLNVSCKDHSKAVKQTKITFKKEGTLTIFKKDSTTIPLEIEIADTEFDRETGLMYRNTMKNDRGMLFVFQDEAPRYFYMKNTEIPLDIIYLDANQKIVSIQKNAEPFNEGSLPSEGPAKYVLEVNGGLSDVWKLSAGDSIAFKKD